MGVLLDASTQATLDQTILGIHDSRIIRYVTAVGTVLMLYDHVLTFADEVQYIWKARPSIAKWLFLINRYGVPITHICVAVFMNHFGFDSLSKASCQGVVTIAFLLGVTSNACANVLVILRVITLWDRDYRVAALMALGFFASFFASLSILISILHDAYGQFQYIAYIHTCVTTLNSKKLPALWASVLVFEVLVLLSVIFNALSRPRSRANPLRRSLYRDGIFFFACSASLQTVNLVMSVAARSSLDTSPVFFVWALITLILNRSLLSIHKASHTSQYQSRSSFPSSSSSSSLGLKAGNHTQHHHRNSTKTITSVQSHIHCICPPPIPGHTAEVNTNNNESNSDVNLGMRMGCPRCEFVDVPIQIQEFQPGHERVHGWGRGREHWYGRIDEIGSEIELESRMPSGR